MADDVQDQAPAKAEIPAPNFLEVFRAIEDGVLNADLTSDMVDLVHNMRALALATGTKPKATISLAIEIKLDGGVFEIVPSYKIKPPKKPRSRSIFFPTKDGGLSTQNQAQMTLGLGKAPRSVVGVRPLRPQDN